MIDKNDVRYKNGLTNLKKIVKKLELDDKFINNYKKGDRCATILSNEDPILMKKAVIYFESSHPDCFVYYTIYQDTPFGTVVNMLYYNNNEEEWYLNELSDDNYIYAATINLDIDSKYALEFGDIKLGTTENKNLCRVG